MIGCAGFYILRDEKCANLSWGMIDRSFHNQGYGTAMLKFRLDEIKKHFSGYSVRMVTSQHTWPFYERHGFAVKEITPDGFAPGLDKYEMIFEAVL